MPSKAEVADFDVHTVCARCLSLFSHVGFSPEYTTIKKGDWLYINCFTFAIGLPLLLSYGEFEDTFSSSRRCSPFKDAIFVACGCVGVAHNGTIGFKQSIVYSLWQRSREDHAV